LLTTKGKAQEYLQREFEQKKIQENFCVGYTEKFEIRAPKKKRTHKTRNIIETKKKQNWRDEIGKSALNKF